MGVMDVWTCWKMIMQVCIPTVFPNGNFKLTESCLNNFCKCLHMLLYHSVTKTDMSNKNFDYLWLSSIIGSISLFLFCSLWFWTRVGADSKKNDDVLWGLNDIQNDKAGVYSCWLVRIVRLVISVYFHLLQNIWVKVSLKLNKIFFELSVIVENIFRIGE